MSSLWIYIAEGELTAAVLLLFAHHVREHALADRMVSRLSGDPLRVKVPAHHLQWTRLPRRTRAAVRLTAACGAVVIAGTWEISPLAGAALTAAAEGVAAALILRPRRKVPGE